MFAQAEDAIGSLYLGGDADEPEPEGGIQLQDLDVKPMVVMDDTQEELMVAKEEEIPSGQHGVEFQMLPSESVEREMRI